ncbi:nicotinamidase/pyrazinamidase [Leclercia adecarboxylata]|uniref:nicotinamidase n=1 Tax=Leclercia adecarboxylata TaxID=83655 RepID=A0A4U9HR87_9ENTR|nr:nicotinamidase/pyrazinamidase [Leclercia adecarboxylata]
MACHKRFWPDHCVQNTEGAELHPLLNSKAIDAVFQKGENPNIDSYSAFFDNGHRQKTGLDQWLRHHEIVELIVMGLATDYCVKFTVLDALQLGYRGECDHRRLSRGQHPAPGQCAGVYGYGGGRRHAVYAGRLAGDAGLIPVWPGCTMLPGRQYLGFFYGLIPHPLPQGKGSKIKKR